MKKNELLAKIRNLPAKQQLAVWIILNKFKKKKYTFQVSDFAEAIKKYLLPKDTKDLARMIGGILSSLVRNKIIKPLTGGRDVIWTIDPDIKKYAGACSDQIFSVVTYWEK